jgi:3-hydroxyisobutyrate dehydrogenase-like beta-hydroxyacid dehydrogenase
MSAVARDRDAVGVIGIGQIGAGVAAALAAAGHPIVGYDAVPAAGDRLPPGATFAASPAEVARLAGIVLVAVLDDAQVRDVLAGDRGILSVASPPRAVAVLSTVRVETIAWAADACKAHELSIVDCGVSGGSAAAIEGRLVSMLGGDDAAVALVRPVIEDFSSHVVHAGPLGAGIRLKLARNLVTYGSWVVAGEAGRLLEACGLDPAKLVDVIRASDPMTGGSTGLLAGPKAGRPPPEALAAIAHKDLGAALSLAAELGVDLPAGTLADELFDELLMLQREAP